MAKLTSKELRKRLAFDYQVAMPMRYELMDLSAHSTAKDAKAGKNAIVASDEGYEAKHYRVEYRIKTLVGRGRYEAGTVVHIDLLANGNYPFSAPSSWVISKPMPWSPHFKKGAPICIGEIWKKAKGQMLLGHLLLHIAKLLNFDEEARGGGYQGWNGEAVSYWKKELQEQPITPDLIYPTLPVEITHRVSQARATRKAAALFQPKERGVVTLTPGGSNSVFHPKKFEV